MHTHRANRLIGRPCVALDYELTAYWGQCIAVSEAYRVTLRYYAGTEKGWQTKTFYHGRVLDPEANDVVLPDRCAVCYYFKMRHIPFLKSTRKMRSPRFYLP